jgi:hypothetical protein
MHDPWGQSFDGINAGATASYYYSATAEPLLPTYTRRRMASFLLHTRQRPGRGCTRLPPPPRATKKLLPPLVVLHSPSACPKPFLEHRPHVPSVPPLPPPPDNTPNRHPQPPPPHAPVPSQSTLWGVTPQLALGRAALRHQGPPVPKPLLVHRAMFPFRPPLLPRVTLQPPPLAPPPHTHRQKRRTHPW